MTEAEWLTASHPSLILDFLRDETSDRKLRLFAVSCCRRLPNLLPDERSRNALEVAERFAEGTASKDELDQAGSLAADAWCNDLHGPTGLVGYAAYLCTLCPASKCSVVGLLTQAVSDIADGLPPNFFSGILAEGNAGQVAATAENVVHLTIGHCIFGNPFRLIVVEPSWLTTTVVALTTGIYQDRAFDRMPILADALQDASCDNDDILNHCRQPGEHVRGCWVVDLLLGKT